MPATRKSKLRYRTRRTRTPGVAERSAETYTTSPAPMAVWVEVAANGRVVIPIELRRALGIEGGGRLFLRANSDVMTAMTPAAALRSAQDLVAKYNPTGRSLVDELIAERREEARRENQGR